MLSVVANPPNSLSKFTILNLTDTFFAICCNNDGVCFVQHSSKILFSKSSPSLYDQEKNMKKIQPPYHLNRVVNNMELDIRLNSQCEYIIAKFKKKYNILDII